MRRGKLPARFALCVKSGGNDDLQPRKVYEIPADDRGAADGLLRLIDESGEDYLYPAEYFVSIELPLKAERALAAIA